MACRDYAKQLDKLEDYLEGLLDDAAAAEVRAHLSGCALCRADVEAAAMSAHLVRAAIEPAGEASGAFWTRLLAQVRAEEERRPAADFWPALELLARRLSLASALMLLILSGYLVGMALRESNEPALRQTETRELIPDPLRQPATQEDVLLTLVANGNGR